MHRHGLRSHFSPQLGLRGGLTLTLLAGTDSRYEDPGLRKLWAKWRSNAPRSAS